MPRNAGGTYSLPAGNPVVAGTVIESVWANTTMNDIAAALTDSLSRSGNGGMLVPFRNADGTILAPGSSWTNEPTSGWYRKATNEFWFAIGATDIFKISADGIELADGLEAIGIASLIIVQDTDPTLVEELRSGEEWFESDTGGLYMRYQNPDDTFTWILLNSTGGDYTPNVIEAKGDLIAGTGVDTLDRLPVGADGEFLVADSAEPTGMRWQETIIPLLHGKCRFLLVNSSTARLDPYNGNTLVINGEVEVIPDAGITLASSALASNDVTYYVYAYMNAGTMTLEVSATGYAVQAGSGIYIKSGDATRTLVGLIAKTAGVFRDDSVVRYLLSWFNRRNKGLYSFVSVTAFSTTPVILAQAAFLQWADEEMTVATHLHGYNTASASWIMNQLTLDGVARMTGYDSVVSGQASITCACSIQLSEGGHMASLYAATDASTGASQTQSGITGMVRG